jgi:putative hemolysin
MLPVLLSFLRWRTCWILAGVTASEWVAFMVVAVCAGTSFYFALAESALFSLGKWQRQQLAEESGVLGREVVELLEQPQDLLATIVLGNTLANAGIVGTALWMGLTGQWSLFWSFVLALVLILVAGEVIPKTLAVRAPERWAPRLVGSVLIFKMLTLPLRKVAQKTNTAILRALVPKTWRPQSALTDEEYQELLEVAYQQGTLARSERDLILQIIRLDRRTAQEVMKPRSQMASIPDDLSVEEMRAAARKHKHRRLPVYDETPDTIVGILNTRSLLLNPEIDLGEAIEFPSFVPETMNLLQLFRSFQRQHRGLAIVLDEFGGTAGVVTMEDILEEVVGELRGEGEPEGFALLKLGEGRWRLDGATRLEDFRREYPELGEAPGIDTVGGLLTAQLGVVPLQGESAVFRGLRLTAVAVDERRVREVLVEALKKSGRVSSA